MRFAPGEYYHIYSRTILSLPEFKDYKSCRRLTQAFLLANYSNSTEGFQYLRNHEEATLQDALEIVQKGERLVDVLCYAIMTDHYHLLVKAIRGNNVSEFIRKCNISISKYINISKERKGTIFESRFHSKHITTNQYLLHLSLYIHLNPLDFITDKTWRNHKLKNWLIQKEKLLKYPWSSLNFYLNPNVSDPIISGSEIILNQFKNRKEYEILLREWSEESMNSINDITID
jgi:REP element-mobilizing transposase RayT